jgi:hypothetical protein
LSATLNTLNLDYDGLRQYAEENISGLLFVTVSRFRAGRMAGLSKGRCRQNSQTSAVPASGFDDWHRFAE